MKLGLILLFILVFITFFPVISFEKFTPNEININYAPIYNNKKYCLVTKNISKEGGKYTSEIKKGKLPKLFDNQKSILINDDFTEDICLNKKFGSGRQRGGFECMDFITKKLAKKYNLEFSNKTCYDKLNFVPIYPEYKNLLNN